jgi:hypothetical protein
MLERMEWLGYRLSILLLVGLEEMLARLSDSIFDVERRLDGRSVRGPPCVPLGFVSFRASAHGKRSGG